MIRLLNEENQLLKQVVDEFSVKEIDPLALKIEKEGITQGVLNSLAENGFLGALAPVEHGGAGLNEGGYTVLLEVLAKHSPSVAMYVFIQNSLFIGPILRHGTKELIQEIIPDIASGKASGAIANYMLSGGKVLIEGSVVSGTADLVPNSNAQMFLVLAKSGNDSKLVLLDDGFSVVRDIRKLGFRGLKFSSVAFNSSKVKAMLVNDGAEMEVQNIYNNSSPHISAIALGISEAALDMAVSYAKERQAFDSHLMEFQPIAFSIARLLSEFNIYEKYLYSISSITEGMMLKEIALEFSRKTSRLSLQVHGGYGYIEDSGVERFYRDAMTLELLTGSHIRDTSELSKELLGSESAKY